MINSGKHLLRRIGVALMLVALFSQFGIAQTYVSGGIFANTTWTAANSPYIVTADVALYQGFTLTMEAGTVVQFDEGTQFIVRGVVDIVGTANNKVTITGTEHYRGSWEGFLVDNGQGGELHATYLTAMHAEYLVSIEAWPSSIAEEAVSIRNSKISSCRRVIYGEGSQAYYTGVLENDTITNIDWAIYYGQGLIIDNCYFANGANGVFSWRNMIVRNSEFTNFSDYAVKVWGLVDNCYIHHNYKGVTASAYVEVRNNRIMQNSIGVGSYVQLQWSGALFHDNVICSNSEYNFHHANTFGLSIPNNCWCTSDVTEISETIYDAYDDINSGIVSFTPITTDCVCDAQLTPTITADADTALCAGDTVTLTSSAAASYSWSTGETTQSIEVTEIGDYSIMVSGPSNCYVNSETTSFAISTDKPSPPTIGTVTHPICGDSTSGRVVLQNLPAVGTWTVKSYPLGITATGTGTSIEITGLTPGIHTFTVAVNGCNSNSSADLVILRRDPPSAPTGYVLNPPTCAVATGRIFISGPLGTNETLARFSLNGGVYSTGQFRPNLTPGPYVILARYVSDTTCVSSPTTIIVPAQPVAPSAATITVTQQATCGTPTGTAEVTAPLGSYEYQIDGGTYQLSTTFSGLSVGSHTVKVRRSNDYTCISTTSTVVINGPLLPTSPAASVTVPLPCPGSSGTATIAVTSPLVGYEYALDAGAFQTATQFTGLSAGTYSVYAREISNPTCVSLATTVTVAQSSVPAIATAAITSQPTCAVPTGGLVITSPIGAYEYSVGGGAYQQSTSFTGIAVGSPTILVRRTNNPTCISPATSVTFYAPPVPPTATVTVTHATCGTPTGTVQVTAPLGNYEYRIDGRPYQSSTTLSGLYTGGHSIIVRSTIDQTCVSASTNFTVYSPYPRASAAVASVTVQPTCVQPTGTIVVSSPLSGYFYSVDNGYFQSGTTFTGLAPGVHEVYVTRIPDTTCVSTATLVTVAAPPTPTVPTVSSIIQPTCANNSGTILFASQAGVQYSVGSGFQVSESFSGLSSGTYTLTVRSTTDATCMANAASTVTINPALGVPDAPTAIVASQPTCSLSTGTVEVTAPLGAYEYSMDAGSYQSSTTFAGVSAGSHSVLARRTGDNTCISQAATVVLNAPSTAPTAAVVSTIQPTCALPSATINITSPLGGYQYAIDGGLFQTSTSFAGVADGAHNILVRNSADTTCVSTATLVTVEESSLPSVPTVSSIIQPTCANNSGTILFASQAEVEYSVGSGFQSNESFSGLISGTYTLTVRSVVDVTCTIDAASTVTINPALGEPDAPTAIVASQPTCSMSTGIVEVTAPLGAYEYSMDAGSYQSSTTFAGVSAGSHSVLVRRTDDNTCVSSEAFVILDLPPSAPIVPTVGTITHPTCALETGSVILSDLPATGTWTLNPGNITGAGTSTVVGGLTAGTYSYTVTNADECISSNTADVVIADQPITPETPTTPTASGGTTACLPGSVNLCSSGSGIFDWQMDGISQAVSSSCFAASQVGTHSYTSTVTDNGCTSNPSLGILVTIFAENVTSITPNGPTAFCEGGNITLIASAGVSYSWSPAGVTTSYLNSDTSGTYTLTTVDGNGCEGSATEIVTVYPNPAPPTILWSEPNLICSPTASGYQWYLDGEELAGETLQTITPSIQGEYSVVITDVNGCISSQSEPYLITLVGLADNQIIDFSIYPNPSNGLFQINIDKAFEYRVYDKFGKLVISGTGKGNSTIDLTSQATGMCVLQLLTDKGLVNHKLLKE